MNKSLHDLFFNRLKSVNVFKKAKQTQRAKQALLNSFLRQHKWKGGLKEGERERRWDEIKKMLIAGTRASTGR